MHSIASFGLRLSRSHRRHVAIAGAAFLFALHLLPGGELAAQLQSDLFNGRDLAGWFGHDPHATAAAKTPHARDVILAKQQGEFAAHWSVVDGELHNDGKGPFATTEKEFRDIELQLEYKTVPLADSGIYLRGTPQVQIWDTTEAGGKWRLNADRGSGGLFNNSAGAAGQLPLVHADKSLGEWNQLWIRQIGARTTVRLNDQLVVDHAIMENYWDRLKPLPPVGPIQLQTHGGEITWRNIRVREIPAEEANRLLRTDDAEAGFLPIFGGTNFDGWQGARDDYEIRERAIVCKPGRGGVLYTKKEWGDFAVRLEFLLPAGGNNGLAIRYPGEGDPAYAGMAEVQVLDDSWPRYSELEPRQMHGSAYGIAAAHRGYLRPVGEWNYQEVVVRGSTIVIELNGTVILNVDLSGYDAFMADTPHPGIGRSKGYFGFAGHNEPVMFRNISIKSLEGNTTPTP